MAVFILDSFRSVIEHGFQTPILLIRISFVRVSIDITLNRFISMVFFLCNLRKYLKLIH